MRDVIFINLIYYSIDLITNIKSIYYSIKRYTPKKRDFAIKIFSKMKKINIIMRIIND